jgi:DNA-binding LytR/AlgR family response regulator
MIKSLLIEDEYPAADRLQKLLAQVAPGIEVTGLLDSVEASVAWLSENECPDLIFLDIQLADGLCFSIFEQVEVQVPVIFTTAYDEYAIRAFDLNSIDYLLKPIDEEKLRESIDKFKALKAYFQKEELGQKIHDIYQAFKVDKGNGFKSRFLVPVANALVPVQTSQVCCFYSEDKETFLLTGEGKRHILGESLDRLETELDPGQFFRVNRQFILSSNFIKKIHNYFNYKLKVELTVPLEKDIVVPRARVREFKAWIEG